uniref:Ribosomal protein L13 n=1 Tax=Hildenbrandia rubra TaxID=31481 RepID=A0A1C9CGC1_9FLOR|nr:ribosomal protein L13 [Hildenbrandia rubra]AOM67412.1 ribosomal protein L13 [Hildenbrandia rubra]
MYTKHKSWYLIDAQNQTLGRLATCVTQILRGKDQVTYLPYLDTGHYVIIINADKVRITGKKAFQKIYYRHSGKPGHLKQKRFHERQRSLPESIIKIAVKGMLPKNSLAKQQLTKLKVYKSSEHPHRAQKPTLVNI